MSGANSLRGCFAFVTATGATCSPFGTARDMLGLPPTFGGL
jgi:hypothetical protein